VFILPLMLAANYILQSLMPSSRKA
jgi:hypothetical protein